MGITVSVMREWVREQEYLDTFKLNLQSIMGPEIEITQCEVLNSTIHVRTDRPIICKGNDVEICELIQKYVREGFNIRLFRQGVYSTFSKANSSLNYVIDTNILPMELYPVADHIMCFKQIDSKNKQRYKSVYVKDDILDKATIDDIYTYATEIAIGRDAIIQDLTEIDYDKLVGFYFEDANLSKILRDQKNKHDRNKFIDQLIEAGYEEWI